MHAAAAITSTTDYANLYLVSLGIIKDWTSDCLSREKRT